jgi:5-methylcytosine-specific restriction protein A
MSGGWHGSDRVHRLPANWEQIRKRIHRRDESRCQVRLSDGRKCLEPATDVDHIRRGDDHRDENLRCICDWHHGKKSAAEGARAYNAKIRRSKQKFRRTEKHPGLL